MTKKTRSPRGTIRVESRNKILRIAFRFRGQRYERSLGLPDIKGNRKAAEAIAASIAAAIALGRFDPKDLDSYLPNYSPPPPVETKSQLDLFDDWCERLRSRGTSDDTLASRYTTLRNHLKSWGPILTQDDAQAAINKLVAGHRSATTINTYRSNLAGFGRWLVQRGHLETNPWADVAVPKVQIDRSKRKAFTTDEVQSILSCAQSPLFAPWYPYIATLLFSGARISEVIGLRHRDLDLEKGTITISGALARSRSSKSRVRKGPKTGEAGCRTIEADVALIEILKTLPQGDPDALLFTPEGGPIDDVMFARTTWRSLLGAAGVPYRPPYTCRHTLLSHLLDGGSSLAQVAAIAGHAGIGTLTRTYIHDVRPVRISVYKTEG